MAKEINPRLVIETDRLDHQSVAIPFTNRIPKPGWVWIFGKLSPVHPDRPPRVTPFVEDDQPSGQLDKLRWETLQNQARQTVWITLSDWVITVRGAPRTVSRFGGVEPRLRPSGHRRNIRA